jgi:hypothetical protein
MTSSIKSRAAAASRPSSPRRSACDDLTIADFSIGGLVPSIKRMRLPIDQFGTTGRPHKS